MRRAVRALNELLWGRVLIVALLAIGLLLSARTRWVQLRYFGAMFALLGSAFQQGCLYPQDPCSSVGCHSPH